MDETIVFEAALPVTSSKSEIRDAVEHFRAATYAAPSSQLAWRPPLAKGAMATLQDNCPRNGHVLIHLHTNKDGFTLKIEGIQREAIGRPDNAPEVKAYAEELLQVMREKLSPIAEHFTINDMVSNFVTWVNAYGHMRQSHYIPHGLENTRVDYQQRLWHIVVAPGNIGLGELIFRIERDRAMVDRFIASVEPRGGLNPVRDEVIDYMHEMAAAIRERWPEMIPSSSPSPAMQALPEKPPIPNIDNYVWDDVFDWFYRAPRWMCPTVGDLMKMVGQAERTFYLQKKNYELQHGQMPIMDGSSKFE